MPGLRVGLLAEALVTRGIVNSARAILVGSDADLKPSLNPLSPRLTLPVVGVQHADELAVGGGDDDVGDPPCPQPLGCLPDVGVGPDG